MVRPLAVNSTASSIELRPESRTLTVWPTASAICEATVKNEKGKSEKLRRAVILLKADMDGPGWNDEKISEALGCRIRTVENVRREFVLEGFEAALVRKKRTTSPTPKLLDGAAEAKLIALRLGKPPAGYGHPTFRQPPSGGCASR